MRFRSVCGEPSYTAQVQLYGDLSEATLSKMTTQFYGVDDLGSLTADWVRKPNSVLKPLRGWKLSLSDLPPGSPESTCF